MNFETAVAFCFLLFSLAFFLWILASWILVLLIETLKQQQEP